MAALPYIQFYVADYLADTFHLTTEEHGAYLLIIFAYWQSGKAIHKSRLAKAARLPNDRWTDVESSLNEYFNEDEKGYWIHTRIEEDLTRVNAKSAQAKQAGKASAAKRAASKYTENKEDSNGRSNPVERESNHTYTYTDTYKDKNNTSNCFDAFWKSYPVKADKKKCLAKWKARNLDDIGEDLISDVQSRIEFSKKWREGFIPNPLTYINGDKWEDELDRGPPAVESKSHWLPDIYNDDGTLKNAN